MMGQDDKEKGEKGMLTTDLQGKRKVRGVREAVQVHGPVVVTFILLGNRSYKS